MRVRAFTQDDAHIFMLPSQIQEEIEGVIDFVDEVYKASGLAPSAVHQARKRHW